MTRLFGFFVIVAAAAGAGLVLVSESGETVRLGYEVAQLETERRQLVEENRKLEVRAAELRTVARLKERVEAFGLDIVPPEELLAGKKAEEKARSTGQDGKTKGRGR